MNQKLQLVSQVPSLRLKRRNLTKMNNPQRNADGDWVVHSEIPRTEGRSRQGAATEAVTLSKTASCETKNSKFEHNQG